REQVTAGPDRPDELRFTWVALNLLPQAAHQHVDAALVRPRDAPLREVEKLVARQHPAGAFAKGVQEVELGSRDRDLGALRAEQLPQGQVDLPAGEGDRLPRRTRHG